MRKVSLAICLASMLCACSNKENSVPSASDMSGVRAKLAFTCTHEADHLPPLDPTADLLFKYGRYLEKKDGPKDFDVTARYYRIAAAYGHYKANNNLQGLLTDGLASSPDAPSEAIDLATQLIKAGVPGGYYDMGHYLEEGYGVEQDADKARRYFRKAADLGNPNAQSYVGDLLAPLDRAPDVAKQMRQCAMDQGFGDAASTLGIDYQAEKQFTEAAKAFQNGVRAGNSQSARFLANGFNSSPSDKLYYLGVQNDSERSRRYKLVGQFIDDNDGLNPKVPDIDQIVPLPPAKLPEWDGTFQWQKEQEAAKPPQKPDEKLVERLAREKNLDPATGIRLKTEHEKELESRVPLGTVVRTGEVCPQSGVWCDKRWVAVSYDATRRFRKGETMPQLVMDDRRPIALLDTLFGMRKHRTNADWSLVSYSDEA